MNNSSPINPEPVVPVNSTNPINLASGTNPISNSAINQTPIQTTAGNDLPWQSRASNQMAPLTNTDTPASISEKSISDSSTPGEHDFNATSPSNIPASASTVPISGSVPVPTLPNSSVANVSKDVEIKFTPEDISEKSGVSKQPVVSTPINTRTIPGLTEEIDNINKPVVKTDIISKAEDDKKHKVKSILMLIGVLVLGIVALVLGIFFAVNGLK